MGSVISKAVEAIRLPNLPRLNLLRHRHRRNILPFLLLQTATDLAAISEEQQQHQFRRATVLVISGAVMATRLPNLPLLWHRYRRNLLPLLQLQTAMELAAISEYQHQYQFRRAIGLVILGAVEGIRSPSLPRLNLLRHRHRRNLLPFLHLQAAMGLEAISEEQQFRRAIATLQAEVTTRSVAFPCPCLLLLRHRSLQRQRPL